MPKATPRVYVMGALAEALDTIIAEHLPAENQAGQVMSRPIWQRVADQLENALAMLESREPLD